MQSWLLHHIKFRSLILYKKKHEIDAHVLNSTQSAIYTKEFLNSPLSLAPLLCVYTATVAISHFKN